jgi:glycosyltransferase involved in cell wall biosynthesis
MITLNLKLNFRIFIAYFCITAMLADNSEAKQFTQLHSHKDHCVNKQQQQKPRKKMKVGIWGAWQVPYEVAFYIEKLKEALDKLEIDIIMYKHTIDPHYLIAKINDDDLDILNIHYEPSLMPFQLILLSIVQEVKQQKVKIVMTVHKEFVAIGDFSPYVDLFVYHKPPAYFKNQKKIALIPSGVPVFKQPPHFHRALLRKKYGFRESDTIIVSTGSFLPNKEIPRIVECLAPYLKEEPSYRLQLLYSPLLLDWDMSLAERQKTIQVIQKHGLQNQVLLTFGFLTQKEISERIWISDIGYQWSTTNAEATPSIVGQFIAVHTPLVLPYSLSHYGFAKGIVTTAHDSTTFVETLMDLILNTPVLDQLRADAVAAYRETNFNVLGAKYLQAFRAILK